MATHWITIALIFFVRRSNLLSTSPSTLPALHSTILQNMLSTIIRSDQVGACSIVIFQIPELTPTGLLDTFIKSASDSAHGGGIALPEYNAKSKTSIPYRPSRQRGDPCNLVLVLVNVEIPEPDFGDSELLQGKNYFTFISTKVLERYWLKLHQPNLKYKLYIGPDPEKPERLTLQYVLHPLGKTNSDASIFRVLQPLPTEEKKTLQFFPDNFAKYGFGGRILKVAVAVLAAWLSELELKQDSKTWKFKRGIEMELLNMLMRRYNFSSEFMPASQGGRTGRLINGTWHGCIGDVYEGRADIGISVGMTSQRNSYVGFSQPYNYARLTFVVGNPAQSYSWKSVYGPLEWTTWLMLLVSTVITFITIYVIQHLESRNPSGQFELIWYALGVLIEKTSDRATTSISTTPLRLYFTMWFIFSTVIGTAYRCKIIGRLMFPQMEPIPETFEELADSDYKLKLQYVGGLAYEMLRTSTNPSHQNIFSKLQLELDAGKCIESTLTTRTSCILWKEIADYLAHSKFSDGNEQVPFVGAPATIFFTPGGLIMSKSSYTPPYFNRLILRMTDMGIFVKLLDLDSTFLRNERRINTVQTPNMSRLAANSVPSHVLSLKQLAGAFLILLVGMAAACLALGMSWSEARSFRLKFENVVKFQ